MASPREQDRIMNALIEKLKEERLEEHEAIKLRLAMGIIFLLAGLIGYLAEKFHLY